MHTHPFSIVGVINTTPDSYVDGGKFMEPQEAVKQAEKMRDEGADIIELGGESTGPGSNDVSVEEELRRIVPTLQAIRAQLPDLPISVDTYKAQVAQAAIEEGAMMINDVTAGRGDEHMVSLIAQYPDTQYVLMYAKDDTARTAKKRVAYNAVMETIKRFVEERIEIALAAGVDSDQIIIDPGMGHFISSDSEYSFEVLAKVSELEELGYPVFVSASRKSFLAGEENLATSDRLPGTIAASSIAVLQGAAYVRTHDVAAVRRGCEIAAAVGRYM